MGVSPSLFFRILHLFSNRNTMMSLYPFSAAKWRAVLPSLSHAFCVDFVVKQHLRHFDLPSKTGDVEPSPVKLCHSVHVGLMLAEQLDDVVMPLVAGIVERGPVI
jgi:hypothetical protein